MEMNLQKLNSISKWFKNVWLNFTRWLGNSPTNSLIHRGRLAGWLMHLLSNWRTVYSTDWLIVRLIFILASSWWVCPTPYLAPIFKKLRDWYMKRAFNRCNALNFFPRNDCLHFEDRWRRCWRAVWAVYRTWILVQIPELELLQWECSAKGRQRSFQWWSRWSYLERQNYSIVDCKHVIGGFVCHCFFSTIFSCSKG